MPRPDSSAIRSLVWLYSSAPQRLALTSLSAIEQAIGESVRPGIDHQVAHARLDWWREECARTAQGRPSHPLTRELTALFAPMGAQPLEGLAGLVDTAAWDLSQTVFTSRPELTAYCERWSGAVMAPLMWLAVPESPPSRAHAFGVSVREIEMLLALAPDARAGRLHVPLDELERAGVAPESLAQPPWSAALSELLRGRHRELRAALAAAVEAIPPSARKPLRALLVWATLACIASSRAQKRLPQASSPRHHHAPLDGWRAWRAARRLDRNALPSDPTFQG